MIVSNFSSSSGSSIEASDYSVAEDKENGNSFSSSLSLIQNESEAYVNDIKSSFHDPEKMNSTNRSKDTPKNLILLVDDELFNLNAIKLVLKYKLDIDVETVCVQAMNGETALEIVKDDAKKNNYKSTSFKFILMDYTMPKMTGPETAALIREFLHSHNID